MLAYSLKNRAGDAFKKDVRNSRNAISVYELAPAF
jgi:hypothetical protein